MSLVNKQSEFAQMVALLLLHANQLGYQVTFGDAYRDDRVKYGKLNSLHRKRLAIDLNLFKNGRYLSATEDHKPLGEYWETLHPDASWGGWFDDGNHYSLEHEGVK